MQEKLNELLMDFNRIDKGLDELYYEIVSGMGISDSASLILHTIYDLGDGYLQKDICYGLSANKQAVNSPTWKPVQEGHIYLEQGAGRGKHISLTGAGKQSVEKYTVPVVQKENAVFTTLKGEERKGLLRLVNIYTESLRERSNEL